MTDTVADTIAAVSGWLTTDARMITDPATFVHAFIGKLHDAGVPVARHFVAMRSLHPQVDAFSSLWEEGKEILFREHLLENLSQHERNTNPLFDAIEHGVNSRHLLTGAAKKNEPDIITDVRQAGMTDYVIVALPFSDGSYRAMTFATRATNGFSDDQVAVLNGLVPALAANVEIRYMHRLAGVLMDTYVGSTAGRKVLAGAIKRGASETIHAVVWFCDLKGFTSLSEKLPAASLLKMLNEYFEVMTAAIEAQRGEVLKFIGDAILAIFQPGDGDGDRDAAARALTAAADAVRALDAVNDARAKHNQPRIDCGIALHRGDLLYGNVGGQRRLDFTVIGPAVNLASRIESLTRELSRTVLVSQSFVDAHGGGDAFQKLGEFSFKGIAQIESVFAPRE